jgi:uncharacterized protein (DUF2384 family)
MDHKILILLGTAANYFDNCREEKKDKGSVEPFEEADVISIDIPEELLKRTVEVFGEEDKAIQWFVSPNQALGAVRPGELLRTSHGRKRVLDELGRIEYGIFI